MSPATTLPVPAAVPEFLAPRIEHLCHTLHAGRRKEALQLAQTITGELAESHGHLHPYALHALELLAFCAQIAWQPTMATEASVCATAAWQQVLDAEHPHIRRQARNAAASWLTITDAPDAVRTGTTLLELLQSVYGKDHPSTPFVERRLNAITGADQEAAAKALRAYGPALMIEP
ncbi:hypothetical protein [Streptomyces sp. 900105245]